MSTRIQSDITLIFETIHGSRAYGLERPDSDLDLKGIIVGPASWYFGFIGGPEQLEESPDHVRYELRKFFRLAVAGNPTLTELLWTEASDHRVVTESGARLLEAREAFLSRRVGTAFGGYAFSQLKRIETHRRWLLSPPQKEPTRSDFGLPERKLVQKDQLGAAEALLEKGRLEEADASTNFLELLACERRYRLARKQWGQYHHWLENRNPARAALESQFGYDTKHAMHLIRLMRMAVEILKTGTVQVKRGDRDELLAIRDGALCYDDLLAEAKRLSSEVEKVTPNSCLPAEPDESRLDDLCRSILSETLTEQGHL